jgi:hypothetical protein
MLNQDGETKAGWKSMTDIRKVRKLFREAGLTFPKVPVDLAPELEERDQWVFSTRLIRRSPYDLDYYVHEVQRKQVPDYALLSHSGHGINSYAIQYYLVHGSLRMFLHLAWGGVYEDNQEAAVTIRACFLKADKIVQAMVKASAGFKIGEHLTVVGSDFYGSYWFQAGASRRKRVVDRRNSLNVRPLEILTEVLDWLAKRSAELRSSQKSRSNEQ